MTMYVPDYLDRLIGTLGGKVKSPLPRQPLEAYFEVRDYQSIVDDIRGCIGLALPVRFALKAEPVAFDAKENVLEADPRAIATLPLEYFVTDVARKLCRVLLIEQNNEFKDDPKAPEFVAMIFGYQNFICNAEAFSDNEAYAPLVTLLTLASRIRVRIPYAREGARHGLLTSEEAHWAREHLRQLARSQRT